MPEEQLHREILQRLTKIESTTDNTLNQATKTNGRVSVLERNQVRIIIALAVSFGLIVGLGSTNFKTVLSFFI